MLKDDGPKQLKEAFLVLIGVAGSIICCGVLMVLGMWMNREKVYFLFSRVPREHERDLD